LIVIGAEGVVVGDETFGNKVDSVAPVLGEQVNRLCPHIGKLWSGLDTNRCCVDTKNTRLGSEVQVFIDLAQDNLLLDGQIGRFGNVLYGYAVVVVRKMQPIEPQVILTHPQVALPVFFHKATRCLKAIDGLHRLHSPLVTNTKQV